VAADLPASRCAERDTSQSKLIDLFDVSRGVGSKVDLYLFANGQHFANQKLTEWAVN
jgi:hypothetical protein